MSEAVRSCIIYMVVVHTVQWVHTLTIMIQASRLDSQLPIPVRPKYISLAVPLVLTERRMVWCSVHHEVMWVFLILSTINWHGYMIPMSRLVLRTMKQMVLPLRAQYMVVVRMATTITMLLFISIVVRLVSTQVMM